jgi:hypothetical protein
MVLTDLISPKWKHSNPDVRLRAIKNLDGEEAAEILRTLAESDPDESVAIAAVGRFSDPSVLERIILARGGPEAPVGRVAADRRNAIYRDWILDPTAGASAGGSDPLELIRRVDDEAILVEIAAAAAAPQLRMAALEGITSPARLRGITEQNCGPQVGLAAVARIDDPDLLRRAARNATNKKVRKAAVERAAALERGTGPSPESLHDDLAALCESLEARIAEGAWDGAETAEAEALSAYKALTPPADHLELEAQAHDPLVERFEGALAALRAGIEAHARRETAWADLTDLCERAETLAADLPPAGQAALAALEARWDAADRELLPAALVEGIEARFDRAREAAQERLAARAAEQAEETAQLDRLAGLCEAAEALADQTDPEAAETALADLSARWTAETQGATVADDLARRWAAASAQIAERRAASDAAAAEARRAEREALTALCETVEGAVTATDRAGLESTVREAQARWRETGGSVPAFKADLAPRFQEARDQFFAAQREYRREREWERWANLTRKEELCVIAETLAEDADLSGRGRMVRDLQSRWKAIGPVSRDRAEAVLTRFHGACDRLLARCRAEKEALVETVARQTDFLEAEAPDPPGWETRAEAIKAAQAAYNDIGPLPGPLEKPLWEAFQGRCNAFFEARRAFYADLDRQRTDNLARKTALCEEAESLAESTDWPRRGVADRIKALQRGWKAIGPVPREVSEPLWNRFQTACNDFFARLDAARPAHLQRKTELCEEAESLAAAAMGGADMGETARAIMAIQETWKSVGPVPEASAQAVWERFQSACDGFFTRYKAHLEEVRAEADRNREIKEALAERAEALADSTAWKETGDELKRLQRDWREVGSAGRAERDLWHRFRSACDTFFTRRNQHFEAGDRARRENQAERESICAHLEVLAHLGRGLEARAHRPDEGGTAPGEVPPPEQLRIALEYRDAVVVPGDPRATWKNAVRRARPLADRWHQLGPPPKDQEAALWNRYRRITRRLFPPRPEGGNPADGTGTGTH